LFLHDENAPRFFLVLPPFQETTETNGVPDEIFGFIDPVLETDVGQPCRAILKPMFPAGKDGRLGRDSSEFPAGRYSECPIGADHWRFPSPAASLQGRFPIRGKKTHPPLFLFSIT
jgi:hypothetical protein